MVVGSLPQECDVAVIGGGPGGYVAAIRAADLGRDVTLIDARDRLGGVCLLEGCIPSKTLIHAVELQNVVTAGHAMGLEATGLRIDPKKLRSYADSVIQDLTTGISGLLKRRNIQVIQATARFADRSSLLLEGSGGGRLLFQHCIIATGSVVRSLPQFDGTSVWSSTEALALTKIPKKLLVVGGGYIGLELGFVYAGLGSEVIIIEMTASLLPGVDADLVKIVTKHAQKRFSAVYLNTTLVGIRQETSGSTVTFDQSGKRQELVVDQVIVAVGRLPATHDLGLEHAGIHTDDRGYIPVNDRCQTVQPNIYAIGDVTAGPMLAHRASRQGKVAAEVIAGKPSAFDNRAIPAVVFVEPELAWVGLTELDAERRQIAVTVGRFPLSALGRARSIGQTDGFVKVIADPEKGLILGVGIAAPHASDLIAEAALAIEMGATLEDLTATIHPHPTLSESMMEAAEVAEGLPIHIVATKKK